MRTQRFSLLFYLLLSIITTHAQIVINEVCASNSNVIEDEYGDSSDWLELYNTGTETVQLAGYHLSDNLTELDKWTFPDYALAPGEWLLVFASDRDLENVYLHTNFKLSASGETLVLSDANGEMLDQLFFEALATDQSIGRRLDGAQEIALFSTPTPGFSNNDSNGNGFTTPPTWKTTTSSFLTNGEVELEHADPTAIIYYTLNGSLPTTDDLLYTGPILFDTITPIRAMAVSADQLPSTVISRTFFVDTNHELPIIAIMGEPADFWSWERGILVDGGPNAEEEWPYWGANYWADIEVPIQMEFFSKYFERLFAERVDTKVHGGRGARTNAMKPLRLLFKEKYGSTTVDYPFFPDRERTTYKRLVLRNASGDYNYGHFRDAFLARYFIANGLNVDVLAHRPVVVYINGEYYGLFNLREKSDQYYIQHNYGISPDQLDLLEEEDGIVTGDFVAFDSMHHFATTTDLSQAENFDRVTTFFDVENIAECFVVQSAMNNGDWLHNNIKYWRERREGARWRYLLFDMDIAMGRHGWSEYDQENLDSLTRRLLGQNKHADLFVSLLANEDFSHYFINRYADLLNTIFRPEIFTLEVDRTIAEINPEMPQHFERWGWPGYERWRDERTPKLYEYLENRPPYAREHIRNYFQLPGEVTLQLNTYPEGAGRIKISTITPEELPWDGIYFQGVPVTLTIEANPGYSFSHWQSTTAISSPDNSPNITYTFSTNEEIIAYFTDAPDDIQLSGSWVQNGVLELRIGVPETQRVELALYDMGGRHIRQLPAQELGGERTVQIPISNLPAGAYYLRAQGVNSTAGIPVLVTD